MQFHATGAGAPASFATHPTPGPTAGPTAGASATAPGAVTDPLRAAAALSLAELLAPSTG